MLIWAHAECHHALAITFKMQVLHTAFIMPHDNCISVFIRDDITYNKSTVELEWLRTSNYYYIFLQHGNYHTKAVKWPFRDAQQRYDRNAIISSRDLNLIKAITSLTHGWCCCGLARCEEYISTNEVSTKAGIKELWGSTSLTLLMFIRTYLLIPAALLCSFYFTIMLLQTSNHSSLQNHANRQKLLVR